MPVDPTAATTAPPAEPTAPDAGGSTPPADTSSAALLEVGDLVTFRFPDAVTGQEITGAGIVERSAAGGVSVLPFAALRYQLAPDQVTVVPQADDVVAAQG